MDDGTQGHAMLGIERGVGKESKGCREDPCQHSLQLDTIDLTHPSSCCRAGVSASVRTKLEDLFVLCQRWWLAALWACRFNSDTCTTVAGMAPSSRPNLDVTIGALTNSLARTISALSQRFAVPTDLTPTESRPYRARPPPTLSRHASLEAPQSLCYCGDSDRHTDLQP